MKLSKSLLKAILIGVSLQSTTSCAVNVILPQPGAETEHINKESEQQEVQTYCPGCGRG